MDISAMVFLSSISIHLACTVYIVSQGAKAVVWLFKFMRDEDKEIRDLRPVCSKSQYYDEFKED